MPSSSPLQQYVLMPSHVDNTDFKKIHRGLTLWVTGTITLQMVLDAKSMRHAKPHTKSNWNLTLPKSFINNNSTEESTLFNDITWSRATNKYMDFINKTLHPLSFKKVIEKAQEMLASMGRLWTDDAMDIDNLNDVQLVDLSDEDCKLKLSIIVPTLY